MMEIMAAILVGVLLLIAGWISLLVEECSGSVRWKNAMEVDRTMEECNGSGWKNAMEVERTMEECKK